MCPLEKWHGEIFVKCYVRVIMPVATGSLLRVLFSEMSTVNDLNIMKHTCMYTHTHLTEIFIYFVVEVHPYGHNNEILHSK